MRRFVLALTALLALASVTLVVAAFTVPSEDTVEPRNQIHRLAHEAQYDSFVPVHYPDLGILVLRHESWGFSVYLERDPTSGCLLEWAPRTRVAEIPGVKYPSAVYGAFHDPGLGTFYYPDGSVLLGSVDRELDVVAHTKPYNVVHVSDGAIREAGYRTSHPDRVCFD